MRQSENIQDLALALVAAQGEIGGAVKGSKNPFFKSTYADLNSVIAELKPIFFKHGFAVIQLPYSDSTGVGVSTRVLHETGQWIEEHFALPLAKPDPQAAGSAITYAKRYALKALGLMPDLDDDAEAAMYRNVEVIPEKPLEQWVADLHDSISAIKMGLANGDLAMAAQCWFELSDEEKRGIWVAPTMIVDGKRVDREHAPWTTAEREIMKSQEFKIAYHGEAI